MSGLPGVVMRGLTQRHPLVFPAGRRPGVDYSHPALTGKSLLRLSVVARGGSLIDVTGRQVGTRSGAVSGQIFSALGNVTDFNTGSGGNITFSGPSVTEPATLAVILWLNVGTVLSNSTGVSPFTIGRGTGGTSSYVVLGIGGGTQFIGPNFLSGGVPYFLAATFGSASPMVVARRLDTGSLLTSNFSSASTNTSNGTYSVGDNGPVAAAAITNAIMTPEQLIQWAYDPWSFWYPPPSTIQLGVGVPAATAPAYGVAQGFAGVVGIASPFYGAGAADGMASVSGVGKALRLATLADRVLTHEAPVPAKNSFEMLSQSVTVAQSAAQAWKWGRTISQALTLRGGQAQKLTYHLTEAETVRLAMALRRAFPAVLAQSLTMHQAQAVAMSVRVLQGLCLVEALGPKNTYHLGLVQALRMSSVLQRFFGETIAQALSVSSDLSRRYVAEPVMTQALTVNARLVNTLTLRLISAIDLTPDQLIRAIYKGDELLDFVNLTGLYVSPSGTATSWAINTRTNAITEYTNYEFVSYAQMGLKYLGADKTGIYELNGEDDAGVGIVAEIQSSIQRLNGAKLGGLKAAYLAVRGSGEYFLKLTSGDGREYVYQVVAQPHFMTTKVNVGKGLRMTYYSWSLISTGQDFDLDGVEFVPMLSDRRV